MNVIVSMISVEGKKVYHRPDCVYVKRMKPQNRMSLSRKQAVEQGCRCCRYCGGLRGEMRETAQILAWQRDYRVSLDYVKKTDTLYVRTRIGCWKIFCQRDGALYLLFHRNTYSNSMPLEQAIQGDYHRQGDAKAGILLMTQGLRKECLQSEEGEDGYWGELALTRVK